MRKLWRQVDAFAPAENTVFRRRLPLGTTVSRYLVRLTGTLTVGTSAATVLEDSPLGFLRSIDVVLNGSFPLKAMDGRGYYFLNRIAYKAPPHLVAPSGAVGSSSFVGEVIINLAQPDLLPPFGDGFLLDTRALSSLEMVFSIGAAADIATPGGTVAVSNLQIVVFAEEVADVGGVLSRMQETRIAQQITGTGDLDISLPPLGPIYRGIAIHLTSHATQNDPLRGTSNDAILANLSLVGDAVTRYYDAAPYFPLRAENKLHYSLESMPPGWIYLDFAKAKTLSGLLVTRQTRALILRLNIASVPANSFAQIYLQNALLVMRQRGGPGAGRVR